jgi:hypothetical protein
MKRIITTAIALIIMMAATPGLSAQGQGQGQGFGQGAMQGDGEKLTAYKIAFFTKN